MKKMIFCLLACFLLELLALVAFEHYHDVLAAFLFGLAFIPSGMFAEAREERKGE